MKTQLLFLLLICFLGKAHLSYACSVRTYKIAIYDGKTKAPLKGAKCKLTLDFETQKCLCYEEPFPEFSNTESFVFEAAFTHTISYVVKRYRMEISHPLYGDTIISSSNTGCEFSTLIYLAWDAIPVDKTSCRSTDEITNDIIANDYVCAYKPEFETTHNIEQDSQYLLFQELQKCTEIEELINILEETNNPSLIAMTWQGIMLNDPVKGLKYLIELGSSPKGKMVIRESIPTQKQADEITLLHYMIREFENNIIKRRYQINKSVKTYFIDFKSRKLGIW